MNASLNTLMESARALGPELLRRAEQTERDRRVSEDIIGQLDAAGLLDIAKPARFGGKELPPSALFQIGYELGRGCGSTAWCAAIANCNAWFASYWPDAAQVDVWGQGRRSLIAGTVVPTGQCAPADGGYLISGRWPFASNCENADWLFVAAAVPASGDAPAGPAWFLTPAHTLKVDQDTWHVSGLQGTGSKTLYSEQPVFVPAHRTIRLAQVQAGDVPGRAIDGNRMARFSFPTFAAVGIIGPILGMARGALDSYAHQLAGKKRAAMRPGTPASAAESPFAQERAGQAWACIEAARALMLAELAAIEPMVAAGAQPDVAARVSVRQAIAFAARQALDVVTVLAEGAGAPSSQLDNPIQRHWRDVCAGARHVSLDIRAIHAMAGQHLFGLSPIGAF